MIRAYDHLDETTLLGRDGVARRFSGDSAALVREVLGFVASPRTPAELLAHLRELSGTEVSAGGAIEEAVALLADAGAIEREPRRAPAPRRAARTRVVLALAGGVAAAFAPTLCDALLARGFEVRVAATKSALRFVSALALEAITHHPVVESLWPRPGGPRVPHLDLAGWAEILVVYPATATTISRIAQGVCSTVVSAAAISTRAPVLVVPSMNEAMYTAPSVDRNLAQLREDGFFVAHPSCGVEVAEPPDARVPMLGAAPPIDAVVDLVESIAREHVRPSGAASETWDDVYRNRRREDLFWSTEDLDPDLSALLDQLDRGSLLDAGTGLGTAAIAAADRGFSVVATDVSTRALALARERAGARPIVWLCDDVLDSRLSTTFDVVLDRALLHVLPRARHGDWAAAMRRLVRPGGALILKCHAPDPERRGPALDTHPLGRAEIAALLGDAFELSRAEDTTLPGPAGSSVKAITALLRRR